MLLVCFNYVLYWLYVLQIFPPACGFSSHFLHNIICIVEVLNFNEMQLINFFLSWVVLLGGKCSHRFWTILSSRSYVFFSIFKSMIHFEINFDKYKVYILILLLFIFLHIDVQLFYSRFIKKIILSPLYYLSPLSKLS